MEVLIKYHSEKMRRTVDFNYLLSQLSTAEGEKLIVTLVQMDEAEKLDAEETVSGITLVRRRVAIFVNGLRREELEREVHRIP